jgi:succinylarginine dihydrolase
MSKNLKIEGINIENVPYTEYNKRKLAQEVVGRLSKEELEEVVFAQQLEAFVDEDVFQICWDFTYNGRNKDE